MDLNDVRNYYTEIINHKSKELSALKKIIFKVSSARLLVFALFICAIYVCWGDLALLGVSVLVFALIFGFLLKYHNRLFKQKRYCEISITDAENELKGLDYDFSAFDGASEKSDPSHSYSFDLDLFGERSFFQSINRTVTSFGKDKFAQNITNPLSSKEDIYNHQNAVKELSSNIDLAVHFRVIGQMTEGETLNNTNFKESLSKAPKYYKNRFWSFMLYLVPLLYVVLGVLCVLNITNSVMFIPLWVGLLMFSFIPMKGTTNLIAVFDKNTEVLETYADLLKIIEEANFSNHLLKDIQKSLVDGQASRSIRELKAYHNNLSQSITFPILLFFNPVLLWNVRYAYKVEKWMESHKDDVDLWFDSVARFDSLVSFSFFAYNHPDYTYPKVADEFVFKGTNLGHPLIKRDVCVRNDVSITKNGYFLVITGANMAGKSTYLRTVGLNHVLACVGAPICGDALEFYPSNLVTNLRTADSLADNESYFFAELKRLKMIIDRLQDGDNLFIILDEILKGTNSQDKQKGSIALMKQLIALNANGIIATHDLVLGDLEKEYPKNVKDYRFEADIKDDKLTFSYKLREGVAQNMNACFLMKKMGVTGLE